MFSRSSFWLDVRVYGYSNRYCNFMQFGWIAKIYNAFPWLPGIVYLHSWDQHHARQEEHDHQGVPDGNVHQICNMNSCRYLPFALPPETMPRDRMANQWILSPVLQIIFFLPADRVLFCQFFQISKVMTFSSSCPTARPIEYHLSSGKSSLIVSTWPGSPLAQGLGCIPKQHRR